MTALGQPRPARSRTLTWQVADPVIRTAGLPVGDLRRLRSATTDDALTRIITLRRDLTDRAEPISTGLHQVIAGLDAHPLRPVVIGLRRAVHQRRHPSTREWAPAVRLLLPPELDTAVAAFLDTLDRHRHLVDAFPAIVAADADRARDALRDVCSDPGFRWALARSTPALAAELDKWLRDPRRRPKPQVLLRLTRYVARAAAKTSPYSTFTVSGAGRWSDVADPLAVPAAADVRTVVELDGRYLQVVTRALSRLPESEQVALVRLNPSTRIDAGEITFIGPPPGEPITRLATTETLTWCLRAVGPGPDGAAPSMAQLLARLTADTGADADTVRPFVRRLVDIGLVETYLPVSDHSPDMLGELGVLLDGAGDPMRAAARDVGEIRAGLLGASVGEDGRSAVTDLDAQRRGHERLQSAASRLAERLGVAAVVPSPVELHESAVVTDIAGTCGIDAWRPVLDDLDLVRRWLAVLDGKLPLRLALGTWVRERYGAGCVVPFVELHRAVQAELRSPSGSPASADLTGLFVASATVSPPSGRRSDPRLRQLDELRTATRVRALSRTDGPESTLDRADIAADIAARPDWAAAPASSACYVQPLVSGDDLRAVLNVVHGGHGRGRSRVAQQIALVGGPAAPPPTDAEGPALAELSGLMGCTLNVRAPGAPFELDYPFSVSARPARERIPLSDLVVTHDEGTDLVSLVSTRLGRPVAPVHLGMFSELQLPAAARFLERAFSASQLMHPSSPQLTPPAARVRTLTGTPRITVGRVVVQRARWYVPAEELPVALGAPDARHLLRLACWLDDHGIPHRSFVRFWGGTGAGGRPKARKPDYLDVANPSLVALFVRHAAESALVIFDEALPDPDRVGGSHVTELLVELTDGGAR